MRSLLCSVVFLSLTVLGADAADVPPKPAKGSSQTSKLSLLRHGTGAPGWAPLTVNQTYTVPGVPTSNPIFLVASPARATCYIRGYVANIGLSYSLYLLRQTHPPTGDPSNPPPPPVLFAEFSLPVVQNNQPPGVNFTFSFTLDKGDQFYYASPNLYDGSWFEMKVIPE